MRLAESLTFLRPLVPYPGWRFDADWDNPDLSFQLRRRVWLSFLDRRCEAPVVVPWHLGTRLRLQMTNDIGRQVFVAGCIDPNELAFLDRFLAPGMTFLDAGANEGLYSVFAAERVGPGGVVWAFEPSVRERDRLRRNMDCNEQSFRVLPLALSDSEGTAELAVAEHLHAGMNSLGAFASDGVAVAYKENTQLVRLDDVISETPPPRIDVIKVDIEGAELRMLRGGVEALRRYRPVLLFEVSRPALAGQGATPEELTDFVRAQGYLLYRFDPQTGLPARSEAQEYSENMIAVPNEMPLPETVGTCSPAPS